MKLLVFYREKYKVIVRVEVYLCLPLTCTYTTVTDYIRYWSWLRLGNSENVVTVVKLAVEMKLKLLCQRIPVNPL